MPIDIAEDYLNRHTRAVEVKDWSMLRAGDRVAVSEDLFYQDGLQVEETAAEIGVIWVRRISSGDRQLLSVGTHRIWHLDTKDI
ncbi:MULTISPECIES: hypothetical protein [unclassified Arthrobacter]|uniref:hypothetical protein n=1 Tax=unclassified Arthrobacter TaxID=235627 RepID=UPI000476FBCD|nr:MULTISPECIES: hypothetical protein [unclassified Arthrobacter]BCW54416.1 hypothetical protein StoSoilB19_17900 [Arthrobacter sp. StoSoilB19]